ncbi:hypothetical protein SKAU_G00280600 [Synaphobranchus kaupii]|uniref:HTH CENPB-type domain-containing protein n=1 Tax=Synaphobranchus kaupii TaxID=118154 RepID=A0A9Q1IMZ6_SYNKA|nr:hypothetical protein SKAU_G00280600 [Synaphobranchus kaupii]
MNYPPSSQPKHSALNLTPPASPDNVLANMFAFSQSDLATRSPSTKTGTRLIPPHPLIFLTILHTSVMRVSLPKVEQNCRHAALLALLMGEKLEAAGIRETSSIIVGYSRHRQVFNAGQEEKLRQYLKAASAMYYGLSPREVRQLAFELAKKNKLRYAESWNCHGMAGKDWFSSFLKRNPQLSIRKPQATSLSRATSFNRTNVKSFFENLAKILDREHLEAKDIWNVDETGVTTVQAPGKIIATKGVKQIGAMTSGERGTLVTVAVAVNAQGNFIPPHLVFPRKRFYPHFIRDAPTGSVGTANGSGWMQEEDFLVFLQHFVKHTRVSIHCKVLLLLDNHASHVSIAAIDFCKQNGVIVLTFPPHCSHKLLPLDRSVFGPFERNMNRALDCWMKTHPARTATIYDLPGLVAQALPVSATPKNIMAGFQCSGIWPFNSEIFGDDDFPPSSVTQFYGHSSHSHLRSEPTAVTIAHTAISEPTAAAIAHTAISEPTAVTIAHTAISEPTAAAIAHTAISEPTAAAIAHMAISEPTAAVTLPAATISEPAAVPSTSAGDFSPVAVRPFPKGEARKVSAKGRKRKVTAILTDTPVKRAMEQEAEERKRKI